MMKRPLLLIAVIAGAASGLAENPAGSPPAPKPERTPLSDAQRAQLEEKADNAWQALSLREKTQLLRFHRALRQLPPEERKFIQDRLGRFLHMTPAERQKLRDNARRWRQMTPEQKDKARELYRQQRQQLEEKWQREHPGEEPPPWPGQGLAAPATTNQAALPPPAVAPPAANQP